MTVKTILAALALSLAPAIGFAACSDRTHQAQSCAAGFVWDMQSQSCVEQATS